MRYNPEFNNNNEEENGPNLENFLNEMVGSQEQASAADFHLGSRDLDQQLLFEAVRILEKSFFWRLISDEKKLNKIKNVYVFLQKILEEEEQ